MRIRCEDLLAAHRVPPSRTTLVRIAQRAGDGAVTARPRIGAYVRRDEVLPEGTSRQVVSEPLLVAEKRLVEAVHGKHRICGEGACVQLGVVDEHL